MGGKPKNAIKGLQGFQKTGRTDPVGHSTSPWGRLLKRLGFGQEPSSTGAFSPSPYPPPPSADFDAPYRAFSSRKRLAPTEEWPEAKTLSDSERSAIWKQTYGRAGTYGPHRRFGIHDAKHDRIADIADLIRQEGGTPRRVGRPGVDDFAYVRQGDIDLQVTAAKNLPSLVLDSDTPEHSRWEGLGVYSRDTVALAKELEETGRYDDRVFKQRGVFPQPDGSEKQVDVISNKVWRLIDLVERDQAAASKLQEGRTASATPNASSSRFSL
jgi:hypothetical protein